MWYIAVIEDYIHPVDGMEDGTVESKDQVEKVGAPSYSNEQEDYNQEMRGMEAVTSGGNN